MLNFRRHLLAALMLSVSFAWMAKGQVVIDNFDKNQGPLSDMGTTASTVTGSMVGGERDVKLTVSAGSPLSLEVVGGALVFGQGGGVTGSADIVWDGTDGNAITVNTSGLGSLNLTSGSQDALLLGVNSCNQSLNVTLTVYSTAGTRTSTISLSASTTPRSYRVAYAAFAGAGNFTTVGAIQLTINSSPGADLKLDFLRTASTSDPLLEATMTDVLLVDNDGNGRASQGDTLRYVVRIKNNDATARTGVQFNAAIPSNTALVPGSVTVTPIANDEGPIGSSNPGDAFHTPFNTTLNGPGGNTASLLSNDFVGSPAATITKFGGGTLGGTVDDNNSGGTANSGGHSLTVNANGSFTYTPASGFTGLFTFDYRLANAAGSDTATVTLAVGARPGAVADSRNVTGNVRIDTSTDGGFSILANDAGDALTINLNTATTLGTVSMSSNGQFIYTPPRGKSSGSDAFSYTLSNGFGTSSAAAVTLNFDGNIVWFIDNSAGGGGDGRSHTPYNTIAAFNAVNNGTGSNPTNGHRILLRRGSGAAYADGITLRNSQVLLGDGWSDTFATGFGFSLSTHSVVTGLTGTDPVITPASGNGVILAADNAVRGLTVHNSPGFGFSGGAVGNLIVAQCSKTGSGGAISITTSGAFGSNVSFDVLESTSSTGANLTLTGVTGSLSVASPGGGFSGSAASAAAINISGGSVGFTYTGNVTKNNTGALLNVASAHTGTLSFSSGTCNATAGTGLQFDNADGTYSFTGTTTLNGGDAGVDILNGSTGTFTFGTSTTITSPSGTAFNVNNSSPSVTYSGSITQNTSGQRVVNVDTTTANTITFQTGTITGGANSTGVNINNANGNVSFANLTLGTSGSRITSQAVTMSGGTGTYSLGAVSIFTSNVQGIVASNADGTINSTSGTVDAGTATAINIDGPAGLTTLGMTLTKVVSNGGTATGIIIQDTNGSFTVNGDGSNTTKGGNGSGGTIANKDDAGTDGVGTVGTGVFLSNATSITLRRMQLNDHKNFAVRGLSVTGFTLQYCTINGSNGDNDSVNEGIIEFGTSNPGGANGLFGTALIDNCNLSGGIENNLQFYNQSGTFNLTVSNSDIKSNSAALGNEGIEIEMQGTAGSGGSAVTVTIQNCQFDDNKSQPVHAAAIDNSVLDITIDNNTVQRTTQGNEGFLLINASNGRLTGHVTNNNISGIGGVAIFVGNTAGNATSSSSLSAVISGNTITTPTTAANSAIIAFLSSTIGQNAPSSILVDNNTVTQNSTQGVARGIFVDTPDTSTTPAFGATVTNNHVAITDNVAGLQGIGLQARRGTGCFDVRSNTVTFPNGTPAGINGIRVRQASPGTANLEQGSSSGTAATVLAANNPSATTEIIGTVTVVANGTCP